MELLLLQRSDVLSWVCCGVHTPSSDRDSYLWGLLGT